MPPHGDEVRNRHDVVVIGAGPAGEAAAELGGNLGYSVALVERDIVGGTVVTSGGAPTKTFREAAVYFSAHVDQIPAAAIYGLPEVARAGKSEEDCAAGGIPYATGRCELGTTPRGVIAGQEGLLKLLFHGGTGVLLGVHAICEIASEIAGTGQALIHNEATIEDVIRMAYNTPTYTYGYKLAAADALARLRPDMLRAMRLPSRAHRI